MTNNATVVQEAGHSAIQIGTVSEGSTVTIITVPESPKSEDYAQVIDEAKKFLLKAEYQKSLEILQTLPLGLLLPGRTHIVRAIATLEGRSFNELSPSQRKNIEQDLLLARQKLGDYDLLPLIILTILEIDYYNYHGQVSKNGIDVASVIEQVSTTNLSKDDVALVKLLTISQKAKNKFRTIFL